MENRKYLKVTEANDKKTQICDQESLNQLQIKSLEKKEKLDVAA